MTMSRPSVREYEGQRIAYLLPDPGIPIGGTKGASVHVDALCGTMARLGASVRLYAATVVGPLRSRGAGQVEVLPVEVGRVRSGPEADSTRLAAAQAFFESIEPDVRAFQPDWIHERLSLFAAGGTELASTLGVPHVVEVNAPVADERIAHFGLRLTGDAHLAEREALRGARAAAVSEPLASWATELGATDATVIPNGADTGQLEPARWSSAGLELRRQLGFDEGRPVVGFVGSLKPWHGVELLLDAVSELAESLAIGVLIVGDGPRRAMVDELARNLPASIRVAVTGSVPSDEVPRYLAAMDIAVAPYLPNDKFYFSPLKVVEAMASGLPVIASDFGPVRDMLGTTGILVPSGDTTALAVAVGELASDPERRRRLGGAGRSRAVAQMDWLAVASRTMDLGMTAHRVSALDG
jgi:glycosyltransferase involved in cell wall biosynthesis